MKTLISKVAVAWITASLCFSVLAQNITIGYASDPVSLDPHEQLSGDTLQLSHMSFDPLVRFTQTMDFEARLAHKWQRLNDTTMRFHLRQGVKFHSGNDMTADDVVWTFKRLQSSADFKAIFEPFKTMIKVDDYTVDLITHKPYPLVLQTATYIFPMDSQFYSGKTQNGKAKDEIVKHGNSFASAKLSGTGPFKVSFREQGVKMEFTRFNEYWDKSSKGNVSKLTLVPIKEDATRVAALLSGDIDLIHPVAPNDHKRIKQSKGIELVTLPGTRLISFQLNQQNEALQNPKVRQAIVHAINNQGIVKKIMKGFATAADQQSPQGYVGHNPSLEPRYDLKKAKQLMKEAGYEKGLTLSMIAPNNRYVNDAKIAQATAAMLSKIGIKVELKTMPKAQYWPEFDKCAADMLMIGWHADTEDSANFSEFLTMTRDQQTGMGQYNCGFYSNTQVDQLVQAANVETDDTKRAQMLQQVESILYSDAAFVPLHWQSEAWGAKANLDAEKIVNPMVMPYLGDLVVN